MAADIITLDEILNRSLLVGLTYLQENREISKQVQIFGRIVEVRPSDWRLKTIALQAIDNQRWSLPLDFPRAIDNQTCYLPLHIPSLKLAPRGVYILASSGEKVTDPDLVAIWTIYSKNDQEYPGGGWMEDYWPFHKYGLPFHWDFTYRHDEDYLRELIRNFEERFLGKTVLIGITNYRGGGEAKELVDRKQLFGKITELSYSEGIKLILQSGEEYTLPPDILSLEPAAPVEYTLASNNVVIDSPDFISEWSVHIPAK